jgi:hypothetical protein
LLPRAHAELARLPSAAGQRSAAPDGTTVEALDPQVLVTLAGRPELKPVADGVARRLASAVAEIATG